MSKELVGISVSGAVHYAVVYNAAAQVWNGTAYEAVGTSAWTTYPVTMTEQTTTGRYVGDSPSTTATRFTMRKRIGGSAAITDPVVWEEQLKYPATIATGDMADISAARAAQIDNLDATVSSRASSTLVSNMATEQTTMYTDMLDGFTTVNSNISISGVKIDGIKTITDQITSFTFLGALTPTVAGRTLDVTATGAAGIDWSNIENPTTVVNLVNTQVGTVTNLAIGAIIPGSFFAGSITSTAFASGVLPTNFSVLGINGSGHISRVTLVDSVSGGSGGDAQQSTLLKVLDLVQQ